MYSWNILKFSNPNQLIPRIIVDKNIYKYLC